jgi:hypothetical protein
MERMPEIEDWVQDRFRRWGDVIAGAVRLGEANAEELPPEE